MANRNASNDIIQRGKQSAAAQATEWLLRSRSKRGVRSPHFWIITALMVFGAFLYYVDQTSLASVSLFSNSFFTGIHDVQRTLFLIPLVYAALVFRVWGSIIASLVFLCIVLPRALLFSPYPDPLLRSLFFVIFAAIVSLLIATQLNQEENDRKARTRLSAAYQELDKANHHLRESQEQLIQMEKLTSLGQMAASIAHEINNPLAGILVYTKLLSKKIAGDSISKESTLDYLSKIDSELTRSARLVRNLLDFARQSPPAIREVNVNEVLKKSLELVAHSAELQKVQILEEFTPSLPRLMADFDQLKQVCTNLILNAIQAMPQGGRLTLRTSAGGGHVRMEFQDTGCGIPPEHMSKLFTPFFTTKGGSKGGVGLGLAVSYGIIQRHQGQIDVQSKAGEGSTFIISLPLSPQGKG